MGGQKLDSQAFDLEKYLQEAKEDKHVKELGAELKEVKDEIQREKVKCNNMELTLKNSPKSHARVRSYFDQS